MICRGLRAFAYRNVAMIPAVAAGVGSPMFPVRQNLRVMSGATAREPLEPRVEERFKNRRHSGSEGARTQALSDDVHSRTLQRRKFDQEEQPKWQSRLKQEIPFNLSPAVPR